MDLTIIAPWATLAVGALGLAGIWYRLGRIEGKLDFTLRALREHTRSDGGAALTPIPGDSD